MKRHQWVDAETRTGINAEYPAQRCKVCGAKRSYNPIGGGYTTGYIYINDPLGRDGKRFVSKPWCEVEPQ